MKREFRVGIVGATGAVGETTRTLLAERKFPVKELVLMASTRSRGRRLSFRGKSLEVYTLSDEALRGLDVVFLAVSTAISREWAPKAARMGALVIDDSNAWRMEAEVPLVIPEVNGAVLQGRRNGIVAIPNCAVTPVAMVLKPWHDRARVTRVVAATYQSVSGHGSQAVEELQAQTKALLAHPHRPLEASVLPHPIAGNVIPHIDQFRDDGSTAEEAKFQYELRKILDAKTLRATATCVRVPVTVAHAVAVNVEFERPLSAKDAAALAREAPGVGVLDRPERAEYPMPLNAAGQDDVFVGRIRRDDTVPHGLNCWVVGDNLRKGAALNAVQIAEYCLLK